MNVFLKAHHSVKISNPAQEAQRKKHFAKTAAAIEAHNANPDATYEMEHNQFSSFVCLSYLLKASM